MRLAALIALLCLAASVPSLPPMPSKPKRYAPAPAITQGSGAAALLPAPLVVVPPKTYTNLLLWDYADLSVVTNFMRYWGPAPRAYTNSVLTGLVLSNKFVWSAGTLSYIAVTAKGTNGLESEYSAEVHIGSLILTNTVINVVTTNGTNLQWAARITGPWTAIGATSYTATNGPYRPFWRAMGNAASTQIKLTHQ